MRYCKPDYYDDFQCLAGDCPDTCCAGWQIYIDEDSLERYEQVEGPFGNRLKNSIDWQEGAFFQCGRRCAFLNEQDLCDLYAELGEDALCETCTRYPRHIEEFEGLRELSLSLSCPEAARIMLEKREKTTFITWETEEEETSFEEDEMDFLLFTWLEDAREVILGIVQNRKLTLDYRMQLILAMAKEIQQQLDDGQGFEIEETIETYRQYTSFYGEDRVDQISGDGLTGEKSDAERIVSTLCNQLTAENNHNDYHSRCQEFRIFQEMELLRSEWGELLKKVWNTLYASGEKNYERIKTGFSAFCRTFGGERDGSRWEEIGEQLLVFFVFTYFCGAVYDEWIESKIRLSVFSVTWIRELCMYRYLEKGQQLSMQDIIEMAWHYAREVEHSDENLGILEEALSSSAEFGEDTV